jgi:hypothetical protein
VSARSGSDAADGRSERTAWKAFTRLGGVKLAPGDALRLRRGDRRFTGCAAGFGTAWYHPPPVFRRVRNVVMEDCVAVDCMNGAFQLTTVEGTRIERVDGLRGGGDTWAGTTLGFLQCCRKVIIRDCIFAGCDRHRSADGTGFDFEGACENVVFAGNVLAGNDGGGLMLLTSGGSNRNILITNNLFVANGQNPWNSGMRAEIINEDAAGEGTLAGNWFFLRGPATAELPAASSWSAWTVERNVWGELCGDPYSGKNWQGGLDLPAARRFAGWIGKHRLVRFDREAPNVRRLEAVTAASFTVDRANQALLRMGRVHDLAPVLRLGWAGADVPSEAVVTFDTGALTRRGHIYRAMLGLTRVGLEGGNAWMARRAVCAVEPAEPDAAHVAKASASPPREVGRFIVAYRDGLQVLTPIPPDCIRRDRTTSFRIRFRPLSDDERPYLDHPADQNPGPTNLVLFASAQAPLSEQRPVLILECGQ